MLSSVPAASDGTGISMTTRWPIFGSSDGSAMNIAEIGGRGGKWATMLSALALGFSGLSFYESVMKTADLEVYVPPVIHYARDQGGDVEQFAIPLTIVNAGARTGTVISMELNVESLRPTPKAEDITGIITSQDKPVQITAKVADPDSGDTVTIAPVTRPAHGSVTVNSTSDTFTYIPIQGYFGDDNFTYQGIDSHGVKSNVATVGILVNAPPAVKDLTVFTVQDTSIAIPLTGTDPDNARGDTVTLSVVANPTHGNVTLDSISKRYVYKPVSNYTGDDAFTYQATDSHGAKSNLGKVSITVLPSK